MHSRLSLTLLIAFLCSFVGLGIFAYKISNGFPLWPEKNVSSWHLELGLKLENSKKNLEMRVALPSDNEQLKIIDSHITDNNFGDYLDQDEQGSFVLWSKKNPEKVENLYYRAVIYKVNSADTTADQALEKPNIRPYAKKLDNAASLSALENIKNKLLSQSANAYNFITGLQKMMRENRDPDLRYLKAKLPNADGATIAAEILNFSDIPAEVINGVLLSSAKRNVKIIRWVNAYTDTQKIKFSPMRQTLGMPSNILPWWKGDQGLVTLNNSRASITKAIAVKRHTESALTEAIWTSSKIKETLYQFTIYALPVELQVVMRILLLIPFGALVCIIIKQIIGIKTFGTFMPVLLAMAFRETSFVRGILIFSFLIIIGIIFRAMLDKMRLLTVPRLGAILTIIVLCVFLLSLSMVNLGFQASGLSLFPLVILTMMIERISVTWDEMGAAETLTITVNTLIVSAICYVVIILASIEHIFTTFPELLLVITALMLLIGRYNGYKLTEYFRFRALRT